MRSRFLAAVIVLCVVMVTLWEMRGYLASSKQTPFNSSTPLVIPLVTPPVATVKTPAPIPVPTKRLPKTAEIPLSQKKSSPQITPSPTSPTPPTTPKVPLTPVAPPLQEWKGNNDSAIKHSGEVVIQNEKQWIHFWAEHHPGEVSPDIDFSRSMVVGVFLGLRPADEFRVELMEVRTLPNAVEVNYIERVPPPGTFQMAVEVYPYDIKVISRSSLHVKFNKLSAQYQKPAPVTGSSSHENSPTGKPSL